LKAELIAAEAEARDKKRKAQGLPVENLTPLIENGVEDEASKRRRLIQEAIAADAEDSDEDEDDDMTGGAEGSGEKKGKEPTAAAAPSEDEEEDSDEDDEDDTAALLRELEKIKRERAAEKERQDAESNEQQARVREEEIATANPLLNLAAALGHNTGPAGTGTAGSFSVKRRWDDGGWLFVSSSLICAKFGLALDRIFKNQVEGGDKSGQFVNDLIRTEFHRKFMAKFIK
jgi:protein CWC15